MIVYIVTCGEYSDYGIVAVFSKKEPAKEYCRRGGEGYQVEEYTLDEPLPDVFIRVIMAHDGSVVNVSRGVLREPGFEWFCNTKVGEAMTWTVKTDDDKRAIKVTNEKRSQIIALNIWGNSKKVFELVK